MSKVAIPFFNTIVLVFQLLLGMLEIIVVYTLYSQLKQ